MGPAIRATLAPLCVLGVLAACAPARALPPRVPELVPTPLETPAESAAPPAEPPAPWTTADLLAEGFEVMAEKDGVTVYRREELPGVELAAEGDLDARPERVLRVLIDYPNHRRWQERLADNRVLARGPNYLDVYQRLSLPVIDDRDFTLHVTWGHDGDVLWMHFTAANERGPGEVSDVVRVSSHEGSWRLAPRDAGRATHASYRFHLDLAGSFPAWLGKGQATSEVPGMFASIRRELASYP